MSTSLSNRKPSASLKLGNKLKNLTLKNKIKKKKQSINKRRGIGLQIRRAGNSLSQHATKYFHALTNPFSHLADGAFVPRFPVTSSSKMRLMSQFQFVIGTGGVGFALFYPTVVVDMPYGVCSTALFAGTESVDKFTSDGVVQNLYFANSPYTAASLCVDSNNASSAVQTRIVSFGVIAEYTGTELNRSGQYFLYEDPTHANAVQTRSNLGLRPECVTRSMSVDPIVELNLHPVRISEFDFTNDTNSSNSVRVESLPVLYPWCAQNGAAEYDWQNDTRVPDAFRNENQYIRAPIAVIVATGVAGSTINCKVACHCEFTGLAAAYNSTQTSVDEAGSNAVLSAVSRIPYTLMEHSSSSRPLPKHASIGRQILSAGAKELIRAGATAAMALF